MEWRLHRIQRHQFENGDGARPAVPATVKRRFLMSKTASPWFLCHRAKSYTWFFLLLALGLTTLALPASAQQTLFTTQTPVLTGVAGANELGMKFQSSVNGTINAIRYWKDAGETGPHVGNIWSSTGTLLGHVTFSGESASGWQQQALVPPVAIIANTTYVVSVNDNTHYVATNSGTFYPIHNTDAGLYFPIENGALTSLADDHNGVFGAPGTFPTQTFEFSNYFRDVVFTPASGSILSQVVACRNWSALTVD
jgi:hypothetical protein